MSTEGGSPRRAVFLDRDGTLNVDLKYISDPGQIELYRGVTEGVRLLSENGFQVVVVTNQSGVSRGFYSREIVDRIHARIQEILSHGGARIDAFYYCPHAPEDKCTCRKPGSALFLQAREAMHLDLAHSVVIGNSSQDMEAGRKVGALTVLVRERHFRTDPPDVREEASANIVAENFLDACQKMISRT